MTNNISTINISIDIILPYKLALKMNIFKNHILVQGVMAQIEVLIKSMKKNYNYPMPMKKKFLLILFR